MALQFLTVPDESLLGHAATGLRLRLADRASECRVIEVNEPKCTIGTAASCTVRLPEKPTGRRLGPMHCVILRGDAQTVVRRLSPGVRLNGCDFTDALLQTGDRLAIGRYEIEVLPPLTSTAEPPRESAGVYDRMLINERAGWQAERDSLCAKLEGANAEIERLAADSAVQAVRQGQTQNAVAQLQAELDQAWKALAEERRQWQIERQQQHAELSQKTATLTATVQQSSRLDAALAKANDRASQQAAAAQAASARYEESQAALLRMQTTLNQQVARFEADRRAWQEERELRLAESQQMSQAVTAAVEASARLQDELDRVTERAEQLDAQTVEYQRTQEALETAANERAEAIEALERERTDRQAELKAHALDISQASAQLADALEKASRFEAELAQANERLAKLAEEIDAQTAVCQRTQDALKIAENEWAQATESLEQERASWQAQLDAAAASSESPELAAALEESSRLRTELSQAKEQFAELNQALEQARIEREHAQAAFDQQYAQWQAEHDARITELSQKSSDLTAAIDQLSHLSLAFAEANAQVQQLTAEIEQRQGDEQLRQAEAAGELSREIAELRSELESAQTLLMRERATWENERRLHQLDRDAVEADAKSRCAILQQKLMDLSSDLDAARNGLAEERAQWQQLLANQQQESEQHLAELRAERMAKAAPVPDAAEGPEISLAEREEESEQEIAAVEPGPLAEQETPVVEQADVAEPAELTGINPSTDGSLTQTDDLLARFAAEQQAEAEQAEAEQAAEEHAAEEQAAEEQELAFEAMSSEAPVTTADLLSRFGLSIEHDASEAPTPESMPMPCEALSQPAAAAPPQRGGTGTEAHHDEQDSIDAYMAQLMARLGRSSYSPPREEEQPTRTVVEEAPREEAAAPAIEIPSEAKLRDPSEMARRALPPELSADLSAMREIANLNARAAIDTHVRRNLLEAWVSKAAVMVLGLGAAGAETWFALEGNDAASYFIVPCFMVAVFWGWQYLTMSKRLNQSRNETAATEGEAEAGDATGDV